MAYFVLEIQKWCDGTWHYIMYQYDNRQSAESKYYYILSEAVLAQIPRNGAVLIDGNGMGRTVHLGGDVIHQAGKFLDQAGLCLHTGLVGVRHVIGKNAQHIAACGGALLDLVFPDAEIIGYVITGIPLAVCKLKEIGYREQKPLRDLAFELFGAEQETFAHDVGLLVAGRPEEFKLRTDRQETVDLEVNAEVAFLKFPLVDDALPA